MAKSKATPKPAKPRPDFPLFPHATKRWAKKIAGKMCYFGPWSDPDAALAKYLRDKDYLQAGQEPPAEGESKLTMVDLCNQFLDSKQTKVDVGKMSQRQHFDYQRSCERLLKIVGRNTLVEALKPRDFDGYAGKLAKGVSLQTFANRVRLARVLFLFASKQDLIPNPLKFGENFSEPDKTAMRADRQSRPAREFTADELRKIIDGAGIPLKAMILLGVNCGFGNHDCGSLPLSAIDLDRGWINFPRPKTAVERRCPLWPETVTALRLAIAKRPEPKDDNDAGLAFITKYGAAYVRFNDKGTNLDGIASGFAKVLATLEMGGNRRAFYSLRRTFESVAAETRDQVCVDHIMGHSPASGDMASVYRQHISDANLVAVAKYVRAWLWPVEAKPESTAQGE